MIKIDMKIPKSCWGCKLAYYDSVYTLHCPFDDMGVDMYPDERLDNCPLIDSDKESTIEQEIRKEINNLSTYRFNNSDTDLVSLKAVKRILNLVFRGYRDKDPKSAHWVCLEDEYGDVVDAVCSKCGGNGNPDYMHYCPCCGAKMESEVNNDNKGVI